MQFATLYLDFGFRLIFDAVKLNPNMKELDLMHSKIGYMKDEKSIQTAVNLFTATCQNLNYLNMSDKMVFKGQSSDLS